MVRLYSGATPQEVSLLREHFQPTVAGTEQFFDGRHIGYRVDANGEWAGIEIYCPRDFHNLIDCTLTVIGFATATHRLQVLADWGASGENKGTHSNSILGVDADWSLTDDIITELDISPLFTANLNAGDYVGIYTSATAVNTANLLVLGVRFRYR